MLLKKFNEAQLVILLSTGSQAAFTEIYNRYWKKLLGIAFAHTKDKSAAEEILQEVFISLWNRRKVVQIHSLNNYLATAVKFSIFKQYQRSRRRREIEQRNVELSGRTIIQGEAELDARFLQDYIDGIVEQLPTKCQLVFQYSRGAGLTIPEISKELDIAEKTVESHLTKALKVIRKNLQESGVLALILHAGLLK